MGPLAGIRVVEMAGIGPAPFGAMLLADLGADVIRIDRVGKPSSTDVIERSHHLLNRGKRSIAIDLKHPAGRPVAERLIDRADVLIEGFRPGVMERLGLGPDACLGRNPGLIYARMTGWGQTGPLAKSAGHDVNYIAIVGALHAIGQAGGPPTIPLNLVGDFAGGSLFLAIGILAALAERTRSGRGQVIDAAIVDGTALLLSHVCGFHQAGLWSETRGANLLDGGTPWYSTYETSDGEYMAIGPIETAFYADLIARLGLDAARLPGQWEKERWPELRAALAAKFRERTREEWTTFLSGTDACVAPVLKLSEAASHPQLAARTTFLQENGAPQPAPAPRFSRTPGSVQRPPCRPGQHSREILREADMSHEQIADLESSGAVDVSIDA